MQKQSRPAKTLRSDARALVDTCAGLHSRLAARRITQFLDRELAESGTSTAQIGLLAQIAAAADDTLAALAERTGLDPSTLSRNLRALEAGGLVEIATVESDLRRRVVWLTETGARHLERAIPVWRTAHAKLARQLDAGRARRLARDSETLVAD
jgi:DNA-binding MarR family transcriptional regulator